MTDEPETERDDQTFSMFGEEETGASKAQQQSYQVLARKYRPKLFSDLIGQEAMALDDKDRCVVRDFLHRAVGVALEVGDLAAARGAVGGGLIGASA